MITEPTPSARDVGSSAGLAPQRTVMFQAAFARLVEAGTKRQTVRPLRQRPIQAGDRLSLREWTGAPYRSKQRVLREAVVTRTVNVCLGNYGMNLEDGPMLTPQEEHAFAMADGFTDAEQMRQWFIRTHNGLPFDGVVIEWANGCKLSDDSRPC